MSSVGLDGLLPLTSLRRLPERLETLQKPPKNAANDQQVPRAPARGPAPQATTGFLRFVGNRKGLTGDPRGACKARRSAGRKRPGVAGSRIPVAASAATLSGIALGASRAGTRLKHLFRG